MGCGGIQQRGADFVARAWCGRGLRDRRPINTRTDRKKPSAWRKGNRKTRRSVNAVSIAQSENFFGAPGRPDGDGRHAAVASAESHSVTSPRWTKACSYADQFPTRYFVLYFGWTFDLMSRSCTCKGQRGQRAQAGSSKPKDCAPTPDLGGVPPNLESAAGRGYFRVLGQNSLTAVSLSDALTTS